MKKHYSGKRSRRFWQQVNALGKRDQPVLYLAGVLLQEMEERVLRLLAVARRSARAR